VVTYATPSTPEEFTELIDGIQWPADCNLQAAAYYDLLARLQALEAGWDGLQSITLSLVQDTQPTLNDWQMAWVDAGYELPISGNVYGVHETRTLETREVGEYVWINGAMTRMGARWFFGSMELSVPFKSTFNNNSVSTTEAKLTEFAVSMKKPGWLDFTMFVIQVGFATDTWIQWRTSFESANTTYLTSRSRLAGVGEAVFTPWRYISDHLASAFSGTLEVWVRRSGAATVVSLQDTLNYHDYNPAYMESIYD
jgi:hypothetical protein